MSKLKSAVPSTPVRTAHVCVLITVYSCGLVVHNTAVNSSDNLPSNHHSLDDNYGRETTVLIFMELKCEKRQHLNTFLF